MKIYKYIILVFVLGLSQQSFSQVSKDKLDVYLVEAAENNPGLKSKFNQYMAAMEKIPQVGTLPDPQFAFGYFIQPVETRLGPQKATFALKQTFPWFGLLASKETVEAEKAAAIYELFENAKANLYFEVKSAYYTYYFFNKAIEITESNMEILRVFKRLSLVKIETGQASIVDELRVELEINDLENQLALYKDSKKGFQAKFNNLLDKEYDALIETPLDLWKEKLPYEYEAITDSINSNNHQLKSIDHKMNAFLKQEDVARKEGMPKFNIGISYIIVGENPNSVDPNNGKDAILFPSVGISIPIYRRKYHGMIKEAQLLKQAELDNKEDMKNTLSSVFEKTYTEFSDGERRIALNERQTEIAKKILDVLITSYSTDSKDFEEVLRIERQLLKYQLAYEKAMIDNNTAVAFIQYLIGN